MRRHALAVLLWLPLSLPARAGYVPSISKYSTPEMDRWLMQGIDDIYAMRFDDAEAAARRVIALSPEHPHAYLGLAGVTLTRYVYETDKSDETLVTPFDKRIQDTISVAQRWVKKHPDDAEGMMVLGAAYGISSRLRLERHEWIKGYLEGRKAVKVTRAAVKADPKLWDAYLGIGMYDYYTDIYPRFIGVLAKIVLRGDRLRGIDTLKLVAERGHYSRLVAQILLVEIYTEDAYGARDGDKAAAIMRELRGRFPDSAMMHSAELVALYEGRRYSEVVSGAEDYLARVARGKYSPIEAGKGNAILATALWARDEKEKALEAFRAAQRVMFKGRPSRWAVWSAIRAAQLEDRMGRREEALKDYKAAYAEPDNWEVRRFAKAGLSKPFDKDFPGRIPPP